MSFHGRRDQALALVHDLRKETERLGRLVRTYVTTADARFLLSYCDILAIRQGDKAPPVSADEASGRRGPHQDHQAGRAGRIRTWTNTGASGTNHEH